MANAGFDDARVAVARFVSVEYRLKIDAPGVWRRSNLSVNRSLA